MFENSRRGRQARNFTTNVPKILDLKSSSEQIFFRKLSLGPPEESKTSSTYVDLSTVFATSGKLEECVFAWAGLKNVLGRKWRSSVSQQQKKSYILLKTLECKMIFRRLFRDEEWNWSGQLVWSDWLIGWLWASINMTLYCVWPQTKKSATNTVQHVSDLRD